MPPISNQLVFFFATGAPALIPTAGWGAGIGAGAAFGNGAPQFEQTGLLPGFLVPHLVQMTVFGWAGGDCITFPASRTLPSFKSPPHCEQVSAVAGLRVPQNPQWMSAPACAAWISFSFFTNCRSDGSSKCTFSG
jgi:hypothetical protein